MTLEDQLLQQLVDTYRVKGRNIQNILDSQLFKDLPLDKKVKFIHSFKSQLEAPPSFNWSGIPRASLLGAATGLGASLTMGKLSPKVLALSAGIGAMSTGGVEALTKYKDYQHDVNTSRSVDDAIQTLINRGLQTSKPLLGSKLLEQLPSKVIPKL